VFRATAGETYKGAHLIGADLIADTLFTTSENDLLQRTLIRHDSYKLAQAIVSLL